MSHRIFHFPICLLAISLLSTIWVGCGSRERPADQAADQGILIWANGTEPVGIDPHVVTGVTENRIISTLLEGLISYHPTDDNIPEPGVAERWESNEDHSVWIFHLRDDARWSNRDPVTAQDFVYSWNRMLSPTFGAKYAEMLYVLENAEAFHKGEIEDFDQVGVQAIDEKTLRVTLGGPTPHFPLMLKHYSFFPVHPPTIEKYGGMNELGSNWTREGYVGNGPFNFAEWTPNQILRVVKSDTYWDRDTVRLNEVHFRPIDNANTEEAAFRNKEVHITNTVPPSKIQGYQLNNPDLIQIDPYLGVYYYRFNTTRPPLDNRKVRQALSLSIDREQIVETITRGGQTPATGFTPPGMEDYASPGDIQFDPPRARELLAEAGYPGGEGFPEVEILYNTLEAHRDIAEAIQNMWEEVLGVEARLLNQEWKVYIPSMQNLEYDIARAGWIGDFMDPITFLSMWTSGNGNNNTGWASPEFDALIREIRRTGDEKARTSLLKEAESLMLSEHIVAPIYWYTRIYLKDPRVQGWYPKRLDNHPIKYVYFEESAE